MYNCHTHIFNEDHIPRNFLPGYVKSIAKYTVTPKMSGFLKKVKLDGLSYLIKKYYNFQKISGIGNQEDIFKHLQGFYPTGTKMVVLSMDMEFMEAGDIPEKFTTQLDQLAKLKQQYPDHIYPFVFAHPDRENVFEIVKKYIEEQNFSGIKLYPAIGYFPADPRLDEVYKYAEKNQIPIMTHCTRGGVYYRGKLTNEKRTDPMGVLHQKQKNSLFTDVYTNPDQYLPILEKYPDLKICFAHYGGSGEWDKYLKESWHQDLENTWLYKVNKLLKDQRYKNVYADISYTLVRTDLLPVLKTFLETNEDIRDHVLFVTDYYMTEIEGSERKFGMNLRGLLGDDLWQKVAEENPLGYLNL